MKNESKNYGSISINCQFKCWENLLSYDFYDKINDVLITFKLYTKKVIDTKQFLHSLFF